jgi:hypothetical protein
MSPAQIAAIAAVRRYLEGSFTGSRVEDFTAMPERQAHRFRVSRDKSTYSATVSFEFLDHTRLEEIPRRLGQCRLAEEMAAAGPRGVLVTEGVVSL